MRHMIAWGGSATGSDGNAAFIPAVTDGVIFSEGDDIRVPSDLAMLAGVAAINTNDQVGLSLITSPRLRRRANLYIDTVTADASIDSQYPYLQYIDQPIMLNAEESLRFQRTVPTVTGTVSVCLVELVDAAYQPVRGDLISLGFTAATSGAALQWNNGTVTFRERLPTGYYDVVGLTLEGSNIVAGRLQLPGLPYRPGALARGTQSISPYWQTMQGNAGRYGRFHTNQPFSLDVLGIDAVGATTGTVQVLAV